MKKRILVVEDFGSIRNFLCDTLNRKGYATIGAADSKEAWTVVSENATDVHLVLTDYNMPDGTGFDLLKKMKANSETANIPVIFLTTESNSEKMKQAQEAGLNAWIKKPYRAEVFFEQIKRIIG